jgi:hypothetical protein
MRIRLAKVAANSGGTAHIGEEHSDVQLNAARWEFLAAGSAQIGIFFARVGIPGAQPACRPRHRRVMTNLAAGRTRQVAKYAMHDTQRAMPFGQNFSPELLGFRLIAK